MLGYDTCAAMRAFVTLIEYNEGDEAWVGLLVGILGCVRVFGCLGTKSWNWFLKLACMCLGSGIWPENDS